MVTSNEYLLMTMEMAEKKGKVTERDLCSVCVGVREIVLARRLQFNADWETVLASC
jgi:hypothetical protein